MTVERSKEPLVSEHMVNEYINLEKDPRWFLGLMGGIAADEPILWTAVENMINMEMITFSQRGGVMLPAPLIRDLDRMLRRMWIRGFYISERRYLRGLTKAAEPDPKDNVVNSTSEGPWSEDIDLTPEDFNP